MSPSETSTGRKIHSLKRRKLAHSPSSESLHPTISLLAVPSTTQPPAICKVPICSSCHRAFPGAKQAQLVQCARCHAPTCTICSRTCTGRAPSVPPTPALTTSTAPSSPDTPLPSPMRPALALNTNNVVPFGDSAATMVAGRRRRVGEREVEQEQEQEQEWGWEDRGRGQRVGRGVSGRKRENDVERDEMDVWRDEKEGEGVLPGCERTVCRNCSFETPESELTTCYDCAGHSPVLA